MRLPGCDYLSVTAAPPQFDPVAYADSLQRLHAAKFSSLELTHYGEVADVSRHLSRYALRVEQAYQTIERMLSDGLTGDALRAAYSEAEHAIALQSGISEQDWQRYQCANPTSMGANGIALFCEKSK
jgi:hypothetical protein